MRPLLPLLALAAPVAAQGMDHMHMPGMTMPAPATEPGPPGHPAPSDYAPPSPTPSPSGTALPAGDAPPPPPPADWAADRRYGASAMAEARRRLMREEGGRLFHQILFNLAEYQARAGGDGFRWDGEAWLGGDVNRLALRTEGEGSTRGEVDAAELQALYSRAVGPYADLQVGLRQDFGARPHRTYATLGAETLLPYMIEGEARLFLSTHGELLGRLEGWYDQRVTQRLVLQPRVELNMAAQSRRATGIGSGLTEAELGLRLRYEFAREFAPYLGASYTAETGRTAGFARAAGRDPTRTSLVAGIRFWF